MKTGINKIYREVASNIQAVLSKMERGMLKKSEDPSVWDWEGSRNDVDLDAVSPKTMAKSPAVPPVSSSVERLEEGRQERMDSSQIGSPWRRLEKMQMS